jgi:hypothetical protein
VPSRDTAGTGSLLDYPGTGPGLLDAGSKLLELITYSAVYIVILQLHHYTTGFAYSQREYVQKAGRSTTAAAEMSLVEQAKR